MRQFTLTLAFLAISLVAFAQSTFTEQTFNTIMEGYKKDPAKFLRNDVAPDFFIVNLDGMVSNAETVAGWNDAATENLNEWSDVKVHQYGNTAVVTCFWKQSHKWKTGGLLAFSNITSATFAYQNNKWQLASWSFLYPARKKADQEAAIKTVIEKETQSWDKRDAEAMASCWANVAYAHQLVYHGTAYNGGVSHVTNAKKDLPENVKALVAVMGKPDGSTFKNENYVINIKDNGNSAFVYFDTVVTGADGTKQTYHEARYLEMTNDEWKIVYVGAVKYEAK